METSAATSGYGVVGSGGQRIDRSIQVEALMMIKQQFRQVEPGSLDLANRRPHHPKAHANWMRVPSQHGLDAVAGNLG